MNGSVVSRNIEMLMIGVLNVIVVNVMMVFVSMSVFDIWWCWLCVVVWFL